ncbi:putative dehydrogenase [Paenibacillus sp. V4I7]|nr:putative dehydrogenase [Paenibacillus sp. V4I7]
MLDHTVHVMDLMNWMTKSEVKEVYAYSATLFNDNLDIDDAGMIHVKFVSGVFGVLDTS